MAYTGQFQVFEDIIKEIMVVYKHDSRPWLIGYSGGKDSTLLTCLVYEAMKRLKDAGSALEKTVHVITSDTMVENPIVKEGPDQIFSQNRLAPQALIHQQLLLHFEQLI